jgi:hypothetical protein
MRVYEAGSLNKEELSILSRNLLNINHIAVV